jgi:hypothetical protein
MNEITFKEEQWQQKNPDDKIQQVGNKIKEIWSVLKNEINILKLKKCNN